MHFRKKQLENDTKITNVCYQVQGSNPIRLKQAWVHLFGRFIMTGQENIISFTMWIKKTNELTGINLALALLSFGVMLAGCTDTIPMQTATSGARSKYSSALEEIVVQRIALAGPAAVAQAEFSGLAWFGDTLILLPQYPERFGMEGEGAVFAISKRDLLARIDGNNEPISPRVVPFRFSSLKQKISGYEGFEAIVIEGERVFLTIETRQTGGMAAALVTGTILPGLAGIQLDAERYEMIPAQAAIANFSDEAITLAEGELISLYEANGRQFNPTPVAHRFELNLQPQGVILAPNLEYRITDATSVNSSGRFWAVNYFFPGDTKIQPVIDPIAEKYGRGASHAGEKQVERLVEMQWSRQKIMLVERAPIYLALAGKDTARNWEGIARLDERGFLLVTDQYPETILGFVAAPQGD